MKMTVFLSLLPIAICQLFQLFQRFMHQGGRDIKVYTSWEVYKYKYLVADHAFKIFQWIVATCLLITAAKRADDLAVSIELAFLALVLVVFLIVPVLNQLVNLLTVYMAATFFEKVTNTPLLISWTIVEVVYLFTSALVLNVLLSFASLK